MELADPAALEATWQDHRQPAHPKTFGEANGLLQDLISRGRRLLVAVNCSKDTEEACPRCMPAAGYRLADPRLILSLLGYC